MLRSSSHAYVCWRCLCRRKDVTAPSMQLGRGLATTVIASAAVSRTRRGFQHLARLQEEQHPVESTTPTAPAPPPPPLSPSQSLPSPFSSRAWTPTRDRLRLWDAENPPYAEPTLLDGAPPGAVLNPLAQISDLDLEVDTFEEPADLILSQLDPDDPVSLDSTTSSLSAGDLLEVSDDSWRIRLLAVCLGTFNGHNHFYTNSGKWFTRHAIRTNFVVKNFIADPAELQPLIDALPSKAADGQVLDLLQGLKAGPSRDIGAGLMQKMNRFQSVARLVHHRHAKTLTRAAEILGHPERLMTLSDISNVLLPPRPEGAPHHTPESLYAIHTILSLDDASFRPMDQSGRPHRSSLYLIVAPDDIVNTKVVERMARDFCSTPAPNAEPTAYAVKFRQFADTARTAIDASRDDREWSRCGMIGPSKRLSMTDPPAWTTSDRRILKFMHRWAVSERFSRASRFHWIGATVLRATGRYDEAESLDPSTGWTFLQEIGWITPWDIHARHKLRLPGAPLYRRGSVEKGEDESRAAPPEELGPDRLAPLRRDFAGITVYCIDSESAEDIDDGVSIEEAGNGEYWIHVHVADPASRIAPESEVAKMASYRAQTAYLAGYHELMLEGGVYRDTFSLAPDRPSLTFSARLTEAGDLVDHTVTPGVLRDVVYMTPESVSAVTGNPDPTSLIPQESFQVGTPPSTSGPVSRKMTQPEELSEKQRQELQTLAKLAKAVHEVRLQKGCVPFYLPRPVAAVSLQDVEMQGTPTGGLRCSGDPYIRISYSGSSGDPLVSSVMQLAGHVAARWCADRNIPIPYRIQRTDEKNLEAVRAFARDVVYPQLAAGRVPAIKHMQTLQTLSGPYDIATSPLPNFSMGMDMYTKATSPLRRYSDMLVHWQIEAALLEEHRTGRSLKPATNNKDNTTQDPADQGKLEPPSKSSLDFLPFSRSELVKDVIPQLRIRERHRKRVDNYDGTSEWILQALVRAWRFGQGAEHLPSTFTFTVGEVKPRQPIRGTLNWFDRSAVIEAGSMGGVVSMADVKAGDMFKVELDDVNVYTQKIKVKVLEKVTEDTVSV
ncbi:hypothetical protein B0T22DRAFT_100541 [Podospora appendiculata]|uniref:RNB domain-containing protein n=1 Tax=Podospora appendiculata TaxID=314037 RepID=A0AAE1CI19_9PEZI|nr:hypothetical protein B0T22DRAFT_100541 [Podospora appendiculata]